MELKMKNAPKPEIKPIANDDQEKSVEVMPEL